MIRHVKVGINSFKCLSRFWMSDAIQKKQQMESPKPYRMPEQKNIQLFNTTYPVRLRNFRTLLYLNKQRLWTPAMLQVPYASAFFGLIYLIRFNPWYLTFPASLPIMMGVEILLFFRWISHKKHYKYIVERVYLYSGNIIEFTFSNKIRRKLKSTEGQMLFNGPEDVETPPHGENGQKLWTQIGTPFPEKLLYKQNKNTKEIQIADPDKPFLYGWTKYAGNYVPYIFPKTYEYANWQILVPLLNGRYINLDNAINQVVELEKGEDYPSAEQQLQWIREDQLKNEEIKKQRLEHKEETNQS